MALIDYFSELTFLRDGDSINFQKASCTLDGCVKIYSTRVDSVADETNKLLNGLADGAGKNKNNKFSPDSMMMEAEGMEREGDDEGEEGKKRVSSKRPHKSVDTLEKSFEALNLKQMDVAFAVDPLFKKTCAEFDESGSKGFLASNITLGPSGKLLFDSADAPSFDDKDEADMVNGVAEEIDLTSLLQLLGSELAEIEMKPISPSLGDYNLTAPSATATKLDKGLTETLSKLTELTTELNNRMDIDHDDSNSDSEIEPDVGLGLGVGVGLQQLIADEDIVPMNDDYEVYDDLEAMPMVSSAVIPESSAVCDPASVQLPGAITKSASQGIQQLEVITEMAEADDGEPNLFAYFDGNLQRNWAGPEHWKIRRPHLMLGRDKGQVDLSTAGARPPKTTKKDFVLDFDCEAIDLETIFVKANPASITLTRSAIDSRSENNNLLPEDLHFSSTELVRLFLKPSWSLAGKKTTTTITRSVPITVNEETPNGQNTEELPADYWTNNAAVPLSNDYFDPDDVVYDDNDQASGDVSAEGDFPLPDAPSQSNIMDHGKDLVPTFKSTSAISINYARVAKRVDVQELKRVMWDEFEKLSLSSASKPSSGKDKTKQMADAPHPTTLTSLITSLPQTNISKETLQDVSVSYCFICLLHLANEHNLELLDQNEEIQVCPSN